MSLFSPTRGARDSSWWSSCVCDSIFIGVTINVKAMLRLGLQELDLVMLASQGDALLRRPVVAPYSCRRRDGRPTASSSSRRAARAIAAHARMQPPPPLVWPHTSPRRSRPVLDDERDERRLVEAAQLLGAQLLGGRATAWSAACRARRRRASEAACRRRRQHAAAALQLIKQLQLASFLLGSISLLHLLGLSASTHRAHPVSQGYAHPNR